MPNGTSQEYLYLLTGAGISILDLLQYLLRLNELDMLYSGITRFVLNCSFGTYLCALLSMFNCLCLSQRRELNQHKILQSSKGILALYLFDLLLTWANSYTLWDVVTGHFLFGKKLGQIMELYLIFFCCKIIEFSFSIKFPFSIYTPHRTTVFFILLKENELSFLNYNASDFYLSHLLHSSDCCCKYDHL